MMKNKLMIFDLDGTLIDSRLDIANALNMALEIEGFAKREVDEIASYVGKGAENLVQRAMFSDKAEDFQRVFIRFLEVYQKNLLQETKLFEGALDFIENSSRWKKAIITNKPLLHTKRIVEGLGLNKYFTWIIGADSLPVLKPDPGVMEPICQEMSDWEQAVMIGDSIVDIDFAKAAKLTSVVLTHGFSTEEELTSAKPDFIVKNFKELSCLSIFSSNNEHNI